MVTRSRIQFPKGTAPQAQAQTRAEFKRRIRSISLTDAFTAVEWLNAMRGTAQYGRVLAVRQELEELGAMLDSLSRQRREARERRKGRTALPSREEEIQLAELYTRFRVRHNDFNRLLSKYTFEPVLGYDPDTGIWRFNPVPKDMRGRAIEVSVGNLTVQVNEASVVAALARLAANRELHKVRLCEQCKQNWRISERQIDRYCSQACREAFYRAQPDFKRRKARNQKNWRQKDNREAAMELARAQALLKGST